MRRGKASVRERYRSSLRRGLLARLEASPAYGFAGLLHAAFLVGLSFWTLAVHLRERPESVEVRLVRSREFLTPTAPRDRSAVALDSLFDAIRPDRNTLRERDSAEPFHEARGDALGSLDALGTIRALGVGGGRFGGGGRGGAVERAGGASSASDGALNGGLDWLVRHRNQQGVWTEVRPDHREGRVRGPSDVARTALALLCFVSAGHGPEREDSPYRKIVLRAQRWLVRRVGSKGRFRTAGGERTRWQHCYEQALGTLALAECLARKRSDSLERAVERAVGFIQRTRTRGLGWRYRPGETDTSVTSWMTLALKSAAHAGVSVERDCFRGVRNWLDLVSASNGTTGYMRRGQGTRAMTATGLFLRIMLGEEPTTPMNRAAVRIVEQTRINRSYVLRNGEASAPINNLYEIYYAALALYQVGGSPWLAFNPRIRDGLVAAQTRGEGCERGSWLGGGHTPGLLLGTTFATLTLETYYRYMPVHQGVGEEPDDDGGEEEAVPSAAVAALARAEELAAALAPGSSKGALLAAEEAADRALTALRGERAPWSLEGRARELLIAHAWRGGELRLVRRRVDDYLSAMPHGAPPSPLVERLRRLLGGREALALAGHAAAPEASEDDRRAALERVRRERSALATARADFAPGDPGRRACERLLEALAEAEDRLAFALDPDAAVAQGLERLAERPAQGPLAPEELRLLVGLLRRAVGRLNAAAKERSQTALAEGLQDLERYDARRAEARCTPEQAARLGPLREGALLALGAARLALGNAPAALEAVADWRARFPQSARAAQGARLERAALASLVVAGRADAAQRRRLGELLRAWLASAPAAPAEELLAYGKLLERAEEREVAAAFYEQALSAKPDPGVQGEARLALARLARLRGDLDAAREHLAAAPEDPRGESVELVLERCALFRADGAPEDALREYLSLLRSLRREDPAQAKLWWRVAEEAGHTFREAKDYEGGRRFLESVRLQDRSFGGDPERRRRFVALMRELDLLR
ncbi:MAG: hypothetical protein D6731_21370 [Planctomycetota bacterium]|nr:MAG: hypothetical protein D6731_21370 [Planctomycetota bacterium]